MLCLLLLLLAALPTIYEIFLSFGRGGGRGGRDCGVCKCRLVKFGFGNCGSQWSSILLLLLLLFSWHYTCWCMAKGKSCGFILLSEHLQFNVQFYFLLGFMFSHLHFFSVGFLFGILPLFVNRQKIDRILRNVVFSSSMRYLKMSNNRTKCYDGFLLQMIYSRTCCWFRSI